MNLKRSLIDWLSQKDQINLKKSWRKKGIKKEKNKEYISMENIEMTRKNNVLILSLIIYYLLRNILDSQFVINTEEIDLKNPSKFEKSLGRVELKIIMN